MDEAFAYFWEARSQNEKYHGIFNLDNPGENLQSWFPSHMSDFTDNPPSYSDFEHYNAWILASAMWDIIKNGSVIVNDIGGSSGDYVPDTFSWDKLFWLPYWVEQPNTFSDYADAVVYWDGRNDAGEQVTSGVYFYTLSTDDFRATRKMILIK